MSAYASLVSLAQTTHKFLQDHDHDQEQVTRLHDHLIFLQEFLEDFPDELANNLEGRIRDLVKQAEDVLEIFISMEIQSVLMRSRRRTAVRVNVDFQTLNEGLQIIAEDMDLIVEEVMEMKQNARAKDAVQFSDFAIATSSSVLAPTSKDVVVGLDGDLLEVKYRLCGNSCRLQFIPIVGMGGIGKTTLAQSAFNDSLTAEHFHIRAWVTVSQDYSAHQIISSLWVSINPFNEGVEEQNGSIQEEGEEQKESIKEKVYKSLKGRRYLIVLDDVWSIEVWDHVRMMFPNDNNGSRIILTSRLYDVARYPDSSSPLHEMRFMDAGQSWNLLKQKVFARENCPSELESIGKTIATSCRGLPLAVVLIAGLLATANRSQATWEKIATNVNAAVNKTNDDQFTKILSLSYIHLPRHLKPCFLYVGLFPKDYEIRASKLIRLWVAEGFLKPNESKTLEEVAEEYLEDLVKRSLVLVTKRKSNGKIKRCSAHDLVWDLCIRKAEEDKFLVMARSASMCFPHRMKNQSRICVGHDKTSSLYQYFGTDSSESFLPNINGSSIRTIIYFQNSGESSFRWLVNFRFLRELDMISCYIAWHDFDVLASFPLEICELFHLRYLAFGLPLINIPAAISNLQNLQTLIIHPSFFRSFCMVLPLQLWRMPQLRHIVSFCLRLLPNPGKTSFALTSLQTLYEVVDLICTVKILKMIPNLKKLGISFESNMDVEDYQLENLVCLHQLETLRLRVHPAFRGKLNPVFPVSLKKLALSGKCGFSWKYVGEIVGLLPRLEVLKLRDDACNLETWETGEGEFLQLKFLCVESSILSQWITESNHFPSLKRLQIRNCPCLIELPDAIGEIPTLELIEVNFFNKSLLKSARRLKVDRFENCGTDDLQVNPVVFLPKNPTKADLQNIIKKANADSMETLKEAFQDMINKVDADSELKEEIQKMACPSIKKWGSVVDPSIKKWGSVVERGNLFRVKRGNLFTKLS